MKQGTFISSIVLKIASRCNINCDYCYVFKHADQSWKKQPRLMSQEIVKKTATRVGEYLQTIPENNLSICLHGGEPLLAPLDYLENLFVTFKAQESFGKRIHMSVQTNGVLLKREHLKLFRNYHVLVSLSLDGPASANDKHRVDFKGRSTFEKVMQAVSLLQNDYPDLFSGVLSVIDPTNNPEELIDFFARMDPPSYNILLPDANYFVTPPQREKEPKIYEDWLKRALTYWYQQKPSLKLKLFLEMEQAVLGLPTHSEYFGNKLLGYLVIETDGTYHTSDILKVAYEGASATGLHVEKTSIREAVEGQSFKEIYDKALLENISETCLDCPEYRICGGGMVSHRFGPKGFNHPTIYCKEMLAMIRRSRTLVLTDQARTYLRDPIKYRKELVSLFFSKEALFLLALLKKRKIPPSFEEEGERLLDQIQTSSLPFNEAIRSIHEVFPSFIKEYLLLFTPFDFLHCSRFNEPESILKTFLKKKLMLLHSDYPLANSEGSSSFETISLIYEAGYLFRFWQTKRLLEPSPYVLLKMQQAFTLLEHSASRSALAGCSEMGKEVVEKLQEEFLPKLESVSSEA